MAITVQKNVTQTKPASNDDYASSPRRIKLDRIDRQILSDLQSHGRMTNVELAERAGISAPPCLRRVRALEDAGYIKGYHANLNSQSLGYTITVFAHVGLKDQSEVALSEFEKTINEWPEVREVYMLAGDTDFLLKIVARDWDAYQYFVTRKLTSAPHVGHVKSALSIRTSKFNPGVPIEVEPITAMDSDESTESTKSSREAA